MRNDSLAILLAFTTDFSTCETYVYSTRSRRIDIRGGCIRGGLPRERFTSDQRLFSSASRTWRTEHVREFLRRSESDNRSNPRVRSYRGSEDSLSIGTHGNTCVNITISTSAITDNWPARWYNVDLRDAIENHASPRNAKPAKRVIVLDATRRP